MDFAEFYATASASRHKIAAWTRSICLIATSGGTAPQLEADTIIPPPVDAHFDGRWHERWSKYLLISAEGSGINFIGTRMRSMDWSEGASVGSSTRRTSLRHATRSARFNGTERVYKKRSRSPEGILQSACKARAI